MPDSRPFPHVLVIGAGIVGAASAIYLSRDGAKVTVLDAHTPSAGANSSQFYFQELTSP